MRTDTCARCGQRIHLLKTGKIEYKWVTDPDKPDSWACVPQDPQFPQLPALRHAPVSAQASHR